MRADITRQLSRTPPGVRELKLSYTSREVVPKRRRTPPGVRELKHSSCLVSSKGMG